MATSRRSDNVDNLPASSDIDPAATLESPAVSVSDVAPSSASATASSAATAAAATATPSSRRKCTVCHRRIRPITFVEGVMALPQVSVLNVILGVFLSSSNML